MLRILICLLCFYSMNVMASQAIIFGDSLSDEGRIYELMDQTYPPAEYYHEGRFSNGKLWTEYAFVERENYAYAGAMSNRNNLLENELGTAIANTGLLSQIDEYLAAHPDQIVEENTAFYISIGANDIFALSTGEEELAFLTKTIVGNIRLAVRRLQGAGAEHIGVIGLPDLSIVPTMKDASLIEKEMTSNISYRFNKELMLLAKHEGLHYISMNTITKKIIQDPEKYGFKNVTDACYVETTQTVCDNPHEYLFWDSRHPTTRVHQMFADSL